MKNIIDLTDKNIVITGGASGIGRQAAITFSELGARLVIVDIAEEGLSETIRLANDGNILCRTADLSDEAALKDVVRFVNDAMGPIDGLVHCAGISSRKPLNVLKMEQFKRMMDINFYSFVELVKLFAKRGYMNDHASILAMSSVSSVKGYKAKMEYCTSKAALDAAIRCSAVELAHRGIRVNAIMAGSVNTPMAQRAREIENAVGADSFNSPLGITEPYEIANTMAFLLSDATRTITGTSILIDGGYMAG